MIAVLLLFLIVALISLGILSASVAIGLYKKSFSAGFRSFLLILFGSVCTAIGCASVFLIDYFFDLPVSRTTGLLIGAASGLTGGLLMAIATYHVFQWIIKTIAQRLRLV